MNRSTLFFALVVVSSQIAFAQQADKHAADEAAIRKAVESYVAAFNKGDAEAVAAHWSPDGVYTAPSGEQFRGRQAIQTEMAAYFAQSKGQHIEVADPTIRFMAPSVATEEGTARVSRAGEPPEETTYIAIHVKHVRDLVESPAH